ncbi:MurR/RpiR family transcriptional regulator [[Clostridium] colinum]|uniref:MurR/RpiR family transcriptional regulator n=1 Tax=[Clostridium] colinum TaxID=36835 RepID=UPI0020257A45|nr:MurR/RpiR family transcriptional regulator [[Clostridium] colinum]
MNKNYEKLNQNDLHICNYILNNRKECINISIQELAKKCSVSHTSIFRLTTKLGLKGYSELKIYLKWEEEKKTKIKENELDKIYNDLISSLNIIKNRDCTDIFNLLDNANKIYSYASGSIQKSVCKFLKNSFLFSNKLLNVIEGREETQIVIKFLQKEDVFFIISLSGNDKFVNDFALKLKNKGVKVISITKDGNNELAQISDINLFFYTHYIKDNVFSTSAFFMISEILIFKYMQYKGL